MGTVASGHTLPVPPLHRRSDSSDEVHTDTSLSPMVNAPRALGRAATSREKRGVNAPATAAAASSSKRARGTKTDAEGAVAAAVAGVGDDAVDDEMEEEEGDKSSRKHRKYERKTKRFIWPDDLHRLFVAAIFDVGLKNASPKSLLALMEAAGPDTGLTTEHLKSHLQKYRLNYERSRMQFLEYYEQSAKRNLKRRRRCPTQHHSHGAGSDAKAATFVFPISNLKRRKQREGYSDSNESDSDPGDSKSDDSRLQADVKGQDTSERLCASPISSGEAHPRSLNYSQLMQSAQQQPATNCLQPPVPNGPLAHAAPTLASTSLASAAPRRLPPNYARAQLKQPSDHDPDLVVATAAAGAYRCPLGQLPGSVAGGVASMPELTDPQWNILSSLMSPQLAGMSGLLGENGPFAQVATSEAMARGGNSADAFTLHGGPTDLQVQMHLAMQAQMNLHRQMLTRKVEVAQHLARHSTMGAMDSSPASSDRSHPHVHPRSYGESWNGTQQFQHQPYQHQQQHDHYHQQMNVIPQPHPSASVSNTQPLVPGRIAQPDTIVAAAVTSKATEIPTPTGSNVSAVGVTDAAGMATETKAGDDGIDLYRWDRIDLNVALDDDDLFGFLKS
ncbi:unnamed protein product [Hyaloperonospora brassicae]|uniref:HTH myb-type domain-containing protein n=1 Tax=Hyaloperonospora brassicae TaxID=162125 RepID=A0AAV0TRB4_HYABA|nr:unnamed protein product [Hyaloperonospora brassicae]